MIPLTSPQRNAIAHKNEILSVVEEVIDSGWYILGEQVGRFEKDFASFCVSDFCCGVANGTDAIELALRALDIGDGDHVFTVSHTATATVSAIERAGATPVLIDIEEQSFTIDCEKLEATLELCAKRGFNPKAIVAVHLYGHPADVTQLVELSKRFDVALIEDCAQAHGAKVNDQHVGTFGACGTFSFYPTKNLGAIGDAGAVVTSSKKLHQRFLRLRQYGWEDRIALEKGINSRLDELQAALLSVKLKALETDISARRQIASSYDSSIGNSLVVKPIEAEGRRHSYHLYVVQVEDRDDFRNYLESKGVGSGIHYYPALHTNPAYAERVPVGEGGLEVTRRVVERIVSLPMFPELTTGEVSTVCDVVNSWEGRL